MLANIKESICIDIANSIRKKNIEKSLFETRDGKIPLTYSPFKILIYFILDFKKSLKNIFLLQKKTSIIFNLFFLILLVPVSLIMILVEIAQEKKSYNKRLNNYYLGSYLSDYDTSDLKSFRKLWDTKGLNNSFDSETKISCMAEWFTILYNKENSEIDKLIVTYQEEIFRTISFFSEKKSYVSVIPLDEALPDEIDKFFGKYS